jgi:hypothetical protein
VIAMSRALHTLHQTVLTSTLLLTSMLLLTAAAVRADDGMSFYGSVAERAQATAPRASSLRSTKDLPMLQALTEGNIRANGRYFDDRVSVFLDVSAFLVAQGGYADRSLTTDALVGVPDHEVASAAPFLALSEAGMTWEPFEHLLLTVGKKRVTFGSGSAVNPTDVLNPRRDPTDPAFQRTGVLLARADVPFEKLTFTALFSPAVLESSHGLPRYALAWPENVRSDDIFGPPRVPDADTELHYAALARVYALVFETDVNAWVIATNRFNDDDLFRPRLAASFARVFLDAHELHGEVLVQQGSTRRVAEPACVSTLDDFSRCAMSGTPLIVQDLKASERIIPRILVGWRYMPADASMLTIEYLYHADGLSPGAFAHLAHLMDHVGTVERAGLGALPGEGASSSGDGALPVRFAFEPLRRHYLIASYVKPQIADDFTVQTTLLMAVEDLSSMATGAVIWQAREWFQLSVFAFVPVPSPGAVSAFLADDDRLGTDVLGEAYDAVPSGYRGYVPIGARIGDRVYGEYDIAPFSGRLMIEARAFF